MTQNIKDICRLCAKKDEFLKDLFDESNRNALTLIQEFIKIVINDCENLPTKICLNCEEKVVSFQLFILECRKAQEYLNSIFIENNVEYSKVKVEDDTNLKSAVEIKSEVKNEFTAEDIVSVINNDASFSDLDVVEYSEEVIYNDNNDNVENNTDENDNDDDYEVSDHNEKDYEHDISKNKRPKKRYITPEESQKLTEILKKSYLKAKDLVKMLCEICGEELKNWNVLTVHCVKNHKRKPLVYCICGFPITSHSVLYKHINDHKAESRKYKPTSETEKVKREKYNSLNVKDFVKFICSSCKKQCSSWYSLKSHSEKAHKMLPVVTCKCGVTLKSKSVLYKHVQDHKSPNVFICDKCPRIMKSLTALNKHKVRHIPKGERKFKCFSCDKIFTSKDSLKSHEKSHIPIEERKIYHCEICNLKFTTRSSATSHKRVVHDRIKSYVCDLCGYACGTNGELRQHRAIHSDEKPFVCNKCSKPFKTYSNLKTHMDTHEDTSYVCFVCNRVLNSRRTLRKHLLVHEDKCRHVCSYCNKAFKRRQTLKVHMYTHTGDKPLSCQWCEARFAYASTLRSHRLRCHPDKMAQSHNTYVPFVPVSRAQEYLKSDVAADTKNEEEAM